MIYFPPRRWCGRKFRSGCTRSETEHKVTPWSRLWEHGGAEVRGQSTSTGMTSRRNNASPYASVHHHVSTVNPFPVRSTRAYHRVVCAHSLVNTHIMRANVWTVVPMRGLRFSCKESSVRIQGRPKNYRVWNGCRIVFII